MYNSIKPSKAKKALRNKLHNFLRKHHVKKQEAKEELERAVWQIEDGDNCEKVLFCYTNFLADMIEENPL